MGTGAQNTQNAVAHAVHKGQWSKRVDDHSQGTLQGHFTRSAKSTSGGQAVDLSSVIYNSPYYGFETKAELFFDLRKDYPHLVIQGVWGAEALSYAAEHITSGEEELELLGQIPKFATGVDVAPLIDYCWQCSAKPVLKLFALCQLALAEIAKQKLCMNSKMP